MHKKNIPYRPSTSVMAATVFALISLPFLTGTAVAEFPTWEFMEESSELQGLGPNVEFRRRSDIERYELEQTILPIVENWVERELAGISDWMEGLSFREPVVTNRPARVAIGNLIDAVGEYDHLSEINIRLNYDDFLTPMGQNGSYPTEVEIDNRETLAHELYHGVQAQFPGFIASSGESTWYSESMPEAIGAEYTGQDPRLGNYEEPLHEPSDPYGRGEFFLGLGKYFGLTTRIEYFMELEEFGNIVNPEDGHHGLVWVNEYMESRGLSLSSYFPQFINEHIDSRAYFPSYTADHTYIDLESEVSAGQVNAFAYEQFFVRGVAAQYFQAGTTFIGNWNPIPDERRIFVNIITIDDAEDASALSFMVYRSLYDASDRHVSAVYAAPVEGARPLPVRVVNISGNPEESEDQEVQFELETAAVEVILPACMEPGESIPLEFEGPISRAEAVRMFSSFEASMSVSAGQLDGNLIYTAPLSEQTITVTAHIPDGARALHSVELPPVIVAEDGCMVRMSAGSDLIVTYAPGGNRAYSEFLVPTESVGMYLSESDVALFEGGWQPIPPQARPMIVNMFNTNINAQVGPVFDLGHPAAGSMSDFQIHRFARIFSERFEWNNIALVPSPTGGTAVRLPTPCIYSLENCTTAEFISDGVVFRVVFDRWLRPERLTTSGIVLDFEYGVFNIRRPPGW